MGDNNKQLLDAIEKGDVDAVPPTWTVTLGAMGEIGAKCGLML